ncbi:unnamed protein product [Brassica rapa]|uniref:Uncharacterized protein n=1 Tax=Brassica campestris TaxID=3711 RepID=A0A8D9M2J6_BRACM|nr:unnamed protein product [Brassica rapa]
MGFISNPSTMLFTVTYANLFTLLLLDFPSSFFRRKVSMISSASKTTSLISLIVSFTMALVCFLASASFRKHLNFLTSLFNPSNCSSTP